LVLLLVILNAKSSCVQLKSKNMRFSSQEKSSSGVIGGYVIYSFLQHIEKTGKNDGCLQTKCCAPSTRVPLGSRTDNPHTQMPSSQIRIG